VIVVIVLLLDSKITDSVKIVYGNTSSGLSDSVL